MVLAILKSEINYKMFVKIRYRAPWNDVHQNIITMSRAVERPTSWTIRRIQPGNNRMLTFGITFNDIIEHHKVLNDKTPVIQLLNIATFSF